MIVFADWTGPVGAVGSAIAAGAALVAIVYAKQAAIAGRDAVSETERLRVEEDFREFGRALQELQHFADDARLDQNEQTMNALRRAQTGLRSVLVIPVRVPVPREVSDRIEIALSRYEEPATVYSAAAQLIADLWDAWEAWQEQ